MSKEISMGGGGRGGNLVPFGKYKGQPVEVLESDPGYVEWLMQQPGIREKYPQLVQIIVNNFGEPEETPEHNQMQARFLQEEWRAKFAVCVALHSFEGESDHLSLKSIITGLQYCVEKEHAKDRKAIIGPLAPDGSSYVRFATPPEFESGKECVDVEFSFETLGFYFDCKRYPLVSWQYFNVLGVAYGECLKKYRIEIKPVVSDNYPVFLRQAKRNKCNFLLYRDYQGHGVDEATFRSIFESQGIKTVRECEVESTPIPEFAKFSKDKFIQNLISSGMELVDGDFVANFGRRDSEHEKREQDWLKRAQATSGSALEQMRKNHG